MRAKSKQPARVDVRKQCDAFANDLADQLHRIIADHVDSVLFAARVDAIARVQGAFETAFGSEMTAPQVVEAPPESAKPKSERPIVLQKTIKVSGQSTCSKCGTPGHNARSCARATKISPQSTRDATSDEKPWKTVLARMRAAREQLDTYEADT